MFDPLVHAYAPLVLWIGLGLLCSRWVTAQHLKFLGQALYWVGVPLQVFSLARQANSNTSEPVVLFALLVLGCSLGLAWGCWQGWQWLNRASLFPSIPSTVLGAVPDNLPNAHTNPTLGSFLLATILGNTGFVGLTLTKVLTLPQYSDWAILFSITNNVAGTYGIAVFIASYFGARSVKSEWWTQIKDVLTVPSLWAFMIGINTQFTALFVSVSYNGRVSDLTMI
jgi:predicted permease